MCCLDYLSDTSLPRRRTHDFFWQGSTSSERPPELINCGTMLSFGHGRQPYLSFAKLAKWTIFVSPNVQPIGANRDQQRMSFKLQKINPSVDLKNIHALEITFVKSIFPDAG